MNKATLICEIAKTHEGSLDKAMNLATSAIYNGADVIKFQYYDPDAMPGEHSNYKRYKRSFLSLEQLGILKKHIESKGKEFLLSCFNLHLLENISKKLGCTTIKVPSTYASSDKFIKECVRLFDRVYVSTGFSTIDPHAPYDALDDKTLIRFYCVSEYPTPDNYLFLNWMYLHDKSFRGYSDHSRGWLACLLAYSLGANLIEKHFNPTETKKSWEMDIEELRTLRYFLDKAYDMLAYKNNQQKKLAFLAYNYSFYKSEFPSEWMNAA